MSTKEILGKQIIFSGGGYFRLAPYYLLHKWSKVPRVELTLRQNFPMEFTHKVKTQSGYMTVADAELTALDVVAEYKKVGGLSRAAELLVELCEQTKWDESKLPLLSYFSIATIQRLGYIMG